MAYRPKESEEKIAKRKRTGHLIGTLLKGIGATLRYRTDDPFHAMDTLPESACIFVFWHSQVAASPLWYRHCLPLSRRMAGLMSASGDGEMLAAAFRVFDIIAVRGSTSRGGVEALRVLSKVLEDGYDVAVTPDGPRGPRREFRPGVIKLARLSKRPLYPIRLSFTPCIRLRTWDRFELPLPFGECRLRFGEPIQVTDAISDEDVAARLVEGMGE